MCESFHKGWKTYKGIEKTPDKTLEIIACMFWTWNSFISGRLHHIDGDCRAPVVIITDTEVKCTYLHCTECQQVLNVELDVLCSMHMYTILPHHYNK